MSRNANSEPKARTAAALVFVALFGVALAIGIGELVARRVWTPPRFVTKPVRPQLANLARIERTLADLSKANVEGIFKSSYFRNNSAGFRGPEYSEQPAAGVLRVAVIGDSVTMGSGVSNEEAYPALLADELHDRIPEGRFESLNFGLSGLNARAISRRADPLVRQYHPHLVVYGVTLNDLEGPNYRQLPRLELRRAQEQRYRRYDGSRLYLLRMVWPRLLSLQELFFPGAGTYLGELRDNYFHNPAVWRDFEGALRDIAELCQERNAKLVVFIHTALFYLNRFHPYRPMYDKIARAAADLDLPVIQSLDAHLGIAGESLWVTAGDPHPNAAGHRILAASLADGLMELPSDYLSPSSMAE